MSLKISTKICLQLMQREVRVNLIMKKKRMIKSIPLLQFSYINQQIIWKEQMIASRSN